MIEMLLISELIEQFRCIAWFGEHPVEIVGKGDRLGERGPARLQDLELRIRFAGLARSGPWSIGVLVDELHDAGRRKVLDGYHQRHCNCLTDVHLLPLDTMY